MPRLLCPHPNCPLTFKSQHGRTYHIRTHHIRRRPHQIQTIQLKRLRHLRSARLKCLHYLKRSLHLLTACGADLGHQDGENHGHRRIERIEHPHLTGTICISVLQQVPNPNVVFSTPLRCHGQFLGTRHATTAQINGAT